MVKLKKLNEQVMVITGASSGIGLVAARMAARQGARLVLAARSPEALARLTQEIRQSGAQAIHVIADVGDAKQVQHIADQAERHFGGFDTWVNNAGVSIYGTLMDVALEDMRRLFETNFWGVVHGSLVAAKALRKRGGAIVNIGSTLSDRAIPIQGIYCASKHAVKGFTDALRMELEADKAPISVTLVKPGAIDTPYTHHARNYMGVEPKNPAPVYAPEVVAKTILHCAVHTERDVFAGGGGKVMSALGYFAPRLSDRVMEQVVIEQQKTDKPAAGNGSSLYHGTGTLQERGDYEGHVAESSLYTNASLHPVMTAALAVGTGLTVAALLRAVKGRAESLNR